MTYVFKDLAGIALHLSDRSKQAFAEADRAKTATDKKVLRREAVTWQAAAELVKDTVLQPDSPAPAPAPAPAPSTQPPKRPIPGGDRYLVSLIGSEDEVHFYITPSLYNWMVSDYGQPTEVIPGHNTQVHVNPSIAHNDRALAMSTVSVTHDTLEQAMAYANRQGFNVLGNWEGYIY